MKMIQQGKVCLYYQAENYVYLKIMLLKDMRVRTYWTSKNSEKSRKTSQKWAKENPKRTKFHSKKRCIESARILCNFKTNGCAICGYNKDTAALDFHHTNPKDKKFLINQNHVQNKNIIEELNKCILLCSNCHRELHSKERKII